jgi:signal transduction histidine kinase
MRITLLLAFFLVLIKVSAQEATIKQLLEKIYDQPDSGAVFLEQAEKLIHSKADSGLFFFYKGEYEYLMGKNTKGQSYFLKSLQYIDSDLESDFISIAYIRLTRTEQTLGQFEKALEFSQEGIKYAQYSRDSNYMAYHLLDIAVTYHDMENFAEGVSYGKRALDILENYSKAKPIYRAYALNSIAINFDDWSKPDSALYYHFQVLEGLDELDSVSINFTFNNIGNTLLKQEKYQEARKWIEAALAINRKRGRGAYYFSTNFTNLATIAYNLNEWEEARQFLDSAKVNVQKSQSTEKRRDYLYEEYRFHKKKGDLTSALNFLEQYSALKDTIFKEDRVRMMGELETRYEVSEKEQQLAKSRAALAENELIVKNRNNQLLLLLIALLLIIGVSFFIFYRQKTKTRHLEQEAKLQQIYAEQKTQKELQEQKRRISSDLHDNIGAQLTFIISSLNNLKFVNLPKEGMAQKLDQISDFTTETINELRDTIWAMNKDSISLSDLQGRIAALLDKAKRACPQIQFDLEVNGTSTEDHVLNSFEGINYYRIAQEAINNAIKHAAASKIRVKIEPENSHLKILIEDDGRGVSSEDISGNGLGNMKTRAERIGRNFEIESSPEKGTRVSVN